MDTLLNRSPDSDAPKRPPLPVMRRSEEETGSIGFRFVFAAADRGSNANPANRAPAQRTMLRE
jgi:hypothetical protein